MSLVFKTPLNAKNLTSKGSQNIDSPYGCNLEEGSVEYNENGEYTLTPESADGFSSVEITVDVPSDVNNQSKEATPTTSAQEIEPDANYTGLSKVTIAGVTASIDANITAGNIKKDVEILGVTGSYDPQPSLQAKSATPTTSQQVIEPDQDKDGLSSVTISGVTAAIDQNIAAGNIKKDVTILGVTGSYEPALQAKTVSSSTSQQVVEADSPNYGLSSVTVEPYVLQAKTATPTTSQQVIEADNDKDGLSSVTVAAVTSAIDANIAAGNIKEGVTILGVTGSYDPQPNLDTLNVTPSTSAQTLTPTSPVDGFDEVVVSAVTSSIDANIAAGNIKKDVTILGVTGTYEGSGGTNVPDWSSIGWSSSDVTASGLVADLSTNYSNSTTHFLPGSLDVSVTQIKNNTNVHYSPAATVLQGIGASYSSLFFGCTNLERVSISKSDTSDSDASNMFNGCTNLKSVAVDMTGISNVGYMFNNCHELSLSNTTFSNFGTTNTSYMFYGLKKNEFIESIPIDTSNVTNMSHMFDSSNTRFASTPMNTANVTDMSYMFANRSSGSTLYGLPTMNTSNVTNMKGMFYKSDCGTGMKAILDLWDTSKVTNFSSMFSGGGAYWHDDWPEFNMSAATDVSSMFSCQQTQSAYQTSKDIPQYNWGKVENVTNVFSNHSVETFGGFIDLGKSFKSTDAASYHTLDIHWTNGSATSNAQLMNIINNLAAPDDTSVLDATLKLSSSAYALLSASDIAVATAKNWSVVSA